MMCSRPVEYSIDTFLGDPQVKNRKNRFFFSRFFQKCSKISVNIEFCLKNTLNTPKGHFLPIFHHISQYKPLQKIDFLKTKIVIFEIFLILMIPSIIWPDRTGNVIYGLKCVLWTSKILLHTLDIIS